MMITCRLSTEHLHFWIILAAPFL
ncbi:hypothetical protein LINPERPRIM_LOCUS27437 [Linum perenne]